MKKTAIALCTLLFTYFFTSAACTYNRNQDGVTIFINSSATKAAQLIKLQVVNNNIIRVAATPNSAFDDSESLCVIPQPICNTWSVLDNNDHIILQTEALKAFVSKVSGKVTFTNLQGEPILQERIGGGKFFSDVHVDGDSGFSIRQVFESPADEAFYGLGQHQSDEFNYKGKNETLYQYNTKVAVPFIISSKNYGVLWHNYSLTKFGVPREYSQLNDLFLLRDKVGTEGGLSATYTNKADTIERSEAIIDYENLETIQLFPKGFSFNGAKIAWEGTIDPKESGLYRFILYYAGYTTVYLDNQVIVPERWRTAWNPNSFKFNANLKAGGQHSIRIEWKPDGGTSYIGLKALSPVEQSEQERLSFWSEMANQIDYYFIKGSSIDEVVSGYRTLTGKAQVMPKWAMGFWQSRERYKTQKELLDVLKEFRKRQIPIDNIVLDWSYWPQDAWGSHDFDSTRFPNPQKMVSDVHAMDARIMISVWPKFYHTTEHFKAFDKHGWMYRLAIQDSIRDWIGKGHIGSFYDAFSEGARRLFWQQMNDKLYTKGFDAWWMDASEPDILSNADMGYRKALMNPTSLGSSTRYFNAYGLMNAKGIYEGQRATNPNDRVFLLTRSGFMGSQKYAAAIWSGDIGTRWEDMKAQISAGLNFSITGNPYWAMDNGGFCVEKRYEKAKEGSEDMNEWRELNVRWHQFGAFVPLFRTHGQYPYREVWNIAPEGHPAYQSMLYYTQLRYRLMPYIYSLAGLTHHRDYTIMRILAMDFSADKNVLSVSDQYMFGPSIMVCPVYEYKVRTRSVYLPAGKGWYDFYSGAYYESGKQQVVDAPYEQIPLFVPTGAIIPTGKLVQHTNEKQGEITLRVYSGSNGTFELYEDEGVNYNYEKGAYATIPITYNDSNKMLTIGNRTGTFNGMDSERNIKVIFINKHSHSGIDTEAQGTTVRYTGKKITIKNK